MPAWHGLTSLSLSHSSPFLLALYLTALTDHVEVLQCAMFPPTD